ncbi:MAG: methionine--tRNA ligase [Patescibacteria group bacterium]
MSKYYITTPIYYINDVPHIGHAYTTIAADVLARYYRKKGDNVFFLTGTDEHGAKIAEAAEKAGKEPKAFVDALVPKFEEAWKNLNISYDQFFRTTNPKHEKLVQEFVQKLKDRGFVEKRSYEGLYCVGCEKFLKESELVEGLCPDHKKAPVKQKEENFFFKLSEFAEPLLNKIKSKEFEIGPEARQNEVLGKIEVGLEDVSISRAAVEWGVPFPGDESQTIYVWIDALLNYYTATEIYSKKELDPRVMAAACSEDDNKEARACSEDDNNSNTPPLAPPRKGGEVPEWPADLHLMAKDILWFHAVIWPAMLLALDLPLPKKVFAHGFFTIGGQKMSKTIGNVLDPNQMVEKFGADAVRYALLREFPFGEDGDISEEKIASQYNSLANNIGNLFQRVLSMIDRYNVLGSTYYAENRESLIHNTKYQIPVDKELINLDFMGALKKIDDYAMELNKYIAEKAPWTLAKEGKQEELSEVLVTAYERLFPIAEGLESFMPDTAKKMKDQLKSLNPEPLFPKQY